MSRFPDFESIKLGHKKWLGRFNRQLNSNFSDFNFASLFSLNDNNTVKLSCLRGNLIVRLVDSVSQLPLVSLLGVNEIDESIEELLDYAREELDVNQLTFVPELTVVPMSRPENFQITLDRDNCDYVYSVSGVTVLEGKKFANFRRKVNTCERQHAPLLVSLEPEEAGSFFQSYYQDLSMDGLFQKVEQLSRQRDRLGLEKLLVFWDQLDLSLMGLKVNGGVRSVAVVEEIPQRTLLLHHFLADTTVKGLGEHFFWSLARHFKGKLDLINFEQDLGISGLRKFKQHLQPQGLLKKYVISK